MRAVDGPRWLRRLFGYCWRHPVITLLAGLSAVGGVGLGALTPLLTQIAVDDATSGDTDNLGWVIAGLVALALIRFGSSFLRRWAGGRLSLDVQHDMRQDVFGALQRLDGSGQDRLRTGQVVSRASTDLQMVQSLLAMVPLSAGQVVLFVVSLVIMLMLSPLLTRDGAAGGAGRRAGHQGDQDGAVPGHLGGPAVGGRGRRDRRGGRHRRPGGQGLRPGGPRTRAGCATVPRRLYANRMRAVRLTAKISPGLQALTALGQVGVLALGGYLALIGTISLGTFLAFTLYLAQLVAPTRMLTMLLVLGQQARASVERVLEIIDSLPEITERADPLPLPGRSAGRRVRRRPVRLRAARTRCWPVFDLHVPAGLDGRAGRRLRVGQVDGVAAAAALLRPAAGRRCGSAVSTSASWRWPDLRGAVGVVFEEAFLFSDSIAANIGYGRPGRHRRGDPGRGRRRRGRRLHRGAAGRVRAR